MNTDRPVEYLVSLVRELCKLPHETEWVEFKNNNADPQEIGQYLSALANSAALVGKAFAYLIWGIKDEDHSVVGTTFSPRSAKYGNEELENWLLRSLSPKIHFSFFEIVVNGLPIVLLEIERAAHQPVRFQEREYIRVGSYKKPIKEFPEKERALWRLFDTTSFEEGIATERISDSQILELLDIPSYFFLLKVPQPQNPQHVLQVLESDKIISKCIAGGWNIFNLGAILFAKRLNDFPTLRRKAIRVIQYKSNSRIETLKEQVAVKGYASGFEELIAYINGLLPANEVIGQALRKSVPMYPEAAIRELVANALIHQDFYQTGVGPMVEIFENRVEITNPGKPLVDTQRFVDTAPRSRNESLASLMRRLGICEERGSGWDKIVLQTEIFQLPAPLVESVEGQTRIMLFSHQGLTKMDKADRIRAVYLHACLRYVNREQMTNTSVRERFGIDIKNSAVASRLIREAVDGGMIAPYDSTTAPKFMHYVPFWAASDQSVFT